MEKEYGYDLISNPADIFRIMVKLKLNVPTAVNKCCTSNVANQPVAKPRKSKDPIASALFIGD